MLCVGVNMRIHPDAGGVDAGSNVCAILHMNAAIGAKLLTLPSAIQIDMGNTGRSQREAEDGIKQAHIHIAHSLRLPMRMVKVFKCRSEEHTSELQSPM